MKRSSKTAAVLGLALILTGAPACDKDKADDQADDKAAAKADEVAEGGHGEIHHGEAKPAADEAAEVPADGRVDVMVDASGYHPGTITAPAKSKITLAFKRTTESGCGQELVIADLELEKELPLNETVEIEVEVPESGELGFACGMNMYKGKVVPKT